MNKRITITAHIRQMPIKAVSPFYKVVLEYRENGSTFTDDNDGKGYYLYQAEQIFAVLQKTCVGEYEIPTKVAR